MNFSISVVIPAYNVEQFIETAIVSALQQPEVTEVVVVDDGSTDSTCEIVKTLQTSNLAIKLYFHHNHINKGRSATRNLGIKNARNNYIAFLDADDFYCPDRFLNDKEILANNASLDGTYNAVGFHYYRNASKEEILKNKISTLCQRVPPDELFDAVITSKYGYLHLNGLTVKKTVFDVIGYFNEDLMVAEDSDLIYKLALKCSLVSSNIFRPVAKRGVHNTNIFNQDEIYKVYNIKLYESVIFWSCKNKIALEQIDKTLYWLWVFKIRNCNSITNDTFYWFYLFFSNPKILFSYLSIKYFPIIRQRQILFPFLYR